MKRRGRRLDFRVLFITFVFFKKLNGLPMNMLIKKNKTKITTHLTIKAKS